jgi:hypothetical protein
MNPAHLTRDQAELCLGYFALGLKPREVAKAMNVSEAVVKDIKRGKTFADAAPKPLQMKIVIEEVE